VNRRDFAEKEGFSVFKSLRGKQAYFTGCNPGVFLQSLRLLPVYLRDVRTYQKMNPRPSFRVHFRDAFPILTDMRSDAGTAKGHYFYQDLWAAKKIYEHRPSEHYDVGSRIDGFIAHLLVFMPVTVVDIRPLESEIPGLNFFQDDASELANLATGSIHSLSTLHTAEHFGLGRYTDPVDPAACFQFMAALQRVLAPGGRFYISVPVGRERVEFNAHRVFAVETILRSFEGLHLLSFSFVGDDDSLHEDVDPKTFPASEMACGLFEFTKIAA
jgi:hypothetical protein